MNLPAFLTIALFFPLSLYSLLLPPITLDAPAILDIEFEDAWNMAFFCASLPLFYFFGAFDLLKLISFGL